MLVTVWWRRQIAHACVVDQRAGCPVLLQFLHRYRAANLHTLLLAYDGRITEFCTPPANCVSLTLHLRLLSRTCGVNRVDTAPSAVEIGVTSAWAVTLAWFGVCADVVAAVALKGKLHACKGKACFLCLFDARGHSQ